MEAFHTIVLGVGAMGAATAAQLARRLPKGQRVLALEQFDIPNALGSSHGQSRLIRLAYYEHPAYVPLLKRAYALWRNLEKRSGAKVLYESGGIYLAEPQHELVAGSLAAARKFKLEHDVLTPRQIMNRWPQFRVKAGMVGFYEKAAGFLLPEKAVAAFAGEALRRGAVLRAFEPVVSWNARPGEGDVEVVTEKATYRGRRLVITAGPWIGRMVPPLAEMISVTRQSMFWFWPEKPDDYQFGQMPCWCAASTAGGLVYGAPMLPRESAPLGLKVSHHHPGWIADPDAVDRRLLPGEADIVTQALADLLPGVRREILSHRVCLYSNSPDHHFIVDRHPNHANVFLAGGFSGHGFKFASVMGEILADLALTGKTRHRIEFLGLRRFI